MKTLETNMKEMESKKRILEEAVDSLNEEIAKLKAKGNGHYLFESFMTSCLRSTDVRNSTRYGSHKKGVFILCKRCSFVYNKLFGSCRRQIVQRKFCSACFPDRKNQPRFPLALNRLLCFFESFKGWFSLAHKYKHRQRRQTQ